jgi:hypothetical protein
VEPCKPAGDLNVCDPGKFENAGTLEATANATFNGPITNNGTMIVDPNVYLDVTGTITGIGKFWIDSGSTLEFALCSKVAPCTTDSQMIYFEQDAGKLIIDDWEKFAGVITGTAIGAHLTPADLIDLTQLPFVAGSMSVSISYNAGINISTVTFSDGVSANNVTLHLSGNYTDSTWNFASVNGGAGTEVSDPPPNSTTVSGGAMGGTAAASAVTTDFTNADANANDTSLVLDASRNFTSQTIGSTSDGTVGALSADQTFTSSPTGSAGENATPMHGAGPHGFEPSFVAQIASGGTVGTPGDSFHFRDENSSSTGPGVIDVAELHASMSHHEDAATEGPQAISEGGETSGTPGESFHFKDEISSSKGSGLVDVAELSQTPASIVPHEIVAATHVPPAISDGAQAIELPSPEQHPDDHFNIVARHAPSALVTQMSHDLIA